jgi:carbon storage regulator
MLVLTRKLNETIVIDGNITVTVVEVRGNRVKLGLVAPMEVPVMREEIALSLRDREQPLHAASHRAVAVGS